MVPRLPRNLSHPVAIGSGSFASVFRARQSGIDRWVAIKIIHEKDRGRRKELLQEARVQAQINLSSIPRVYDAFGWGRNICIMMEWVKGVPLSTLLGVPLTTEERLFLATRFIEAIASLHAQNFAHRDLKPANVLITADCSVYLVDFGFTKNIADGRASLALVAKGTPAYMAPEVWERGASVDLIRADVFSAGKVLHEILGEEIESDVVKQCLQAHPDYRLASGAALLDVWRSSSHGAASGRECCVAAAATLAAELLADRLVHAAKHLLYAHHNDEAYWLLVEALEENPEHAEAVQLMADFSRFSRKQRIGSGVRWSAAAAVVIAVSLAAFFAGRQSSSITAHSFGLSTAPADERLFSPVKEDRKEVSTILLKEQPFTAEGLYGRVAMAELPDKGFLYINGKKVANRAEAGTGMDLPYGRHDLAWYDETNQLRWKERITLLPFETRVVLVTPVTR